MFSGGPLGFQNMMSEIGSKVEFLFYWTMSQMFLVALGVLGMMGVNFLKGSFYRFEKAVSYYELLWTAFPTIILCSVAGPSMFLLYLHEQEGDVGVAVKCIGHQWYWSYDYLDLEETSLDSFMVPSEDLSVGESRLLEADSRMVVPFGMKVQVFVTSEDVLHSWALPVSGVKIDATPGRLNTIFLFFPSPGVFYGQCSELCGANHSLMPIVVEATSSSLFMEWVKGI